MYSIYFSTALLLLNHSLLQVPTEQTGEPGWLAGEIRGHTGWFPESYVEPVDGVGIRDMGGVEPDVTINQSTVTFPEDTEATRLE